MGAAVKLNRFQKWARTFIKELSAWVLVLPSLICFTVFSWQPLLSGFVLSFYETKGYNAVRFIGLQNYIDVINNSVFQQTLINTFMYVFWSLTVGFLIPIVVAVMINEMRHVQSFFKFAVYFPGMVPGIAAALLWVFLFDPGPGGLLNMALIEFGLSPSQWLQNSNMTILLIILTMTWRAFGGTVILYLASLQGVNRELYEAASLDGAGIWQRLRHVTLSQIAPIIGLLLIMQIIGVFQVFYEPLAMTGGGPNNASMTLMLQSYHYAFTYYEAGRSMAVGGITFVILAVLTVVYFKVNKRLNQ